MKYQVALQAVEELQVSQLWKYSREHCLVVQVIQWFPQYDRC